MIGFAAAAALGALVYGFVFLNRPASLLRAVVKTVMMAALAGGLVVLHAPPLLIAAAIASALGDALLAFDKPWVLPLGILSFLVAQLCYFALFRDLAAGPATEPIWLRVAASGAIALAASGFLVWLWPKLGALAFGVVPYSAAIAAMAMQAMWLPWSGTLAMLGAASFVISDGVLSGELFKLAPDAPARRITGPVVWWTYATAQFLIVIGVMNLSGAL